MELFTTFPTPNPTPDKALAAARVSGQDELLDVLDETLVTAAMDKVDQQETLLRQVYRPLIDTATERVTQQQQMMEAIADPIITGLRSQLGTQQSDLAYLLSRVPSDVREFLTSQDPSAAYCIGFTTAAPYLRFSEGGSPIWENTPANGGVMQSCLPATETLPQTGVVVPAEVPAGFTTTTYIQPNRTEVSLVTPETIPGRLSSQGTTLVAVPAGSTGGVQSQVVPSVTATASGGTSTPGKPGECPAPIVNLTVNCPPGESPRPAPTAPVLPPPEALPESPGGAAVKAFPLPALAPAGGKWVTTSPTLCDDVEAFVIGVDLVGFAIRTGVESGSLAVEKIMRAIGTLGDVNVIGKVLKAISIPADIVATVLESMRVSWPAVAKTFLGPRGDTLLGLFFVRGLLKSLNSFRLGINAIVSADITLEIVPDQAIRICDYLIEYLHPTKLPEMPTGGDLWLRSLITDKEFQCIAELNGWQFEEAKRQTLMRRELPGLVAEVDYFRRWDHGADNFRKRLLAYGFKSDQDIDVIRRSMDILPPPSDAIRFALRDVFDPKKLGRAEMIAELKEQVGLRELLAAVGIQETTIKDPLGNIVKLDVPLLYWMSSYEEASPTQVYEMLHRLRPGRTNRFPLPKAGGGVTFPDAVNIETVRALLKEKDYNPIWRDRLAAISYRVPGRIDTRNIYKLGGFGPPQGLQGVNDKVAGKPVAVGGAEKELVEQYLDQGFSPEDAQLQTWLTAAQFDQSTKAKGRNKRARQICQAYMLGVYDRAGAIQVLTRILGTKEAATDYIDDCDTEKRIADVKYAVAGVRKQFIAGTISDTQAISLLEQYGVKRERAVEMGNTWRLYRTAKQREITAATLVDWFVSGLLGGADLKQRLINLGYDSLDANRIIRRAELGELAKTTKQKEKLDNARRQEQLRQERAVKSEEKERERIQLQRMTRFLAGRSEKNLKEWWTAREIDERDVRETLTLRGWNPADVERWVRVNNPDKVVPTDDDE